MTSPEIRPAVAMARGVVCSFLCQPVQRQVHGLAATEVRKISWGDETPLPTAVYAT